MARPIFFAIFIIIIVFLPLFTLQGVEGKTFRPLAYTVTLAMLGSLIFALVLAPVMAWLLMRRPERAGATTAATAAVAGSGRAYDPLLRSLCRPAPESRSSTGGRAAGRRRGPPPAAGIRVHAHTPGGHPGRPPDHGAVDLADRRAPGSPFVERRLMELPEVVSVVTRIGRGEVGAHTDPVNSAEMFLLLHPRERVAGARRRTTWRI